MSGRITLALRCKASDRGRFSAWLCITHTLRATTIITGRRNSNRPRSGASSSNLACHLNELNEELINHAHISHSYATKQLAATNQSPRGASLLFLSPVQSSHEPSINQSINCRHRFACDRKCFCQNTCSPFLAAALKYYSISAEESHWPT